MYRFHKRKLAYQQAYDINLLKGGNTQVIEVTEVREDVQLE
jgi:hypothetical protein